MKNKIDISALKEELLGALDYLIENSEQEDIANLKDVRNEVEEMNNKTSSTEIFNIQAAISDICNQITDEQLKSQFEVFDENMLTLATNKSREESGLDDILDDFYNSNRMFNNPQRMFNNPQTNTSNQVFEPNSPEEALDLIDKIVNNTKFWHKEGKNMLGLKGKTPDGIKEIKTTLREPRDSEEKLTKLIKTFTGKALDYDHKKRSKNTQLLYRTISKLNLDGLDNTSLKKMDERVNPEKTNNIINRAKF